MMTQRLGPGLFFALLATLGFPPFYGGVGLWVGGPAAFGAYLLLAMSLFGALQVSPGLGRVGMGALCGLLGLLVCALMTGPISLVIGAGGILAASRILLATGEARAILWAVGRELLGLALLGGLLAVAPGLGERVGYPLMLWGFFLLQAGLVLPLGVPELTAGERFERARRRALRILGEL